MFTHRYDDDYEQLMKKYCSNDDKKSNNLELPTIPLRDITIFPKSLFPIFIGKERSVNSLDNAKKSNDKLIFLITQKSEEEQIVDEASLYQHGIVARIIDIVELSNSMKKKGEEQSEELYKQESYKVVFEGLFPAKLIKFDNKIDSYTSIIKPMKIINDVNNYPPDTKDNSVDDTKNNDNPQNNTAYSTTELEVRIEELSSLCKKYSKLDDRLPDDFPQEFSVEDNINDMLNKIASYISLPLVDEQKLLSCNSVSKKLELMLTSLTNRISKIEAEILLRKKIYNQIEQSRELLQKSSSEKDKIVLPIKLEDLNFDDSKQSNSNEKDDTEQLAQRIEETDFSEEAKEKAKEELKRLSMMVPMSSESSVVRNYIDWLLDVPWNKFSKLETNIEQSKLVLNENHYSLTKVKEKVLEFIAVQMRKKNLRGTILCFVGPPGVGKTSIAQSMAKAMNRKFTKIALGGIRDEAEIRGHRKTYLGSLPGKIIQAMKKAGTSDPLILLDEIDKMSYDHKGDPSFALLEALDPEQNDKFNDHYLEVDYDLSKVVFVATANSMNIPLPLKDRMEIIRLSGYTEEEKLNIAKKYSLKKIEKDTGLKSDEYSMSDKVILSIINDYTCEAGVRSMERYLSTIMRKCLIELMTKKTRKKINVTEKNLTKYAGIARYDQDELEKSSSVGIIRGLAYTETGGDVLAIEAVQINNGEGKLQATGKLGEVMKESSQLAYSLLKSRIFREQKKTKNKSKIQNYLQKINLESLKKTDIHLHFPEGATPKDGPSAGIAIYTCLASLLTKIPINHKVAMTGEISLRGRVLPIGGLREKLLAAKRYNISIVCVPKRNEKDLEDIPKTVTNGLKIILVQDIQEVLDVALDYKNIEVEQNSKTKITAD